MLEIDRQTISNAENIDFRNPARIVLWRSNNALVKKDVNAGRQRLGRIYKGNRFTQTEVAQRLDSYDFVFGNEVAETLFMRKYFCPAWQQT